MLLSNMAISPEKETVVFLQTLQNKALMKLLNYPSVLPLLIRRFLLMYDQKDVAKDG